MNQTRKLQKKFNFKGGDNFKPLFYFYHKAGERLMIKCTETLMMMLDF